MCTVSVVPPGGGRGWRLVINRDERRTRSVAWPPVERLAETVTVVSPVDSHGLGTWVAATDEGLAFALVNVSPAAALLPQAGDVSRGTVIPAIVGAAAPGDAWHRLSALRLTSIAPFRVIAVGGRELAWAHWDGRTLRCASEPLVRPRLFASSSLGDDLVAEPRAQLFEQLLALEDDPWRAQDRLHVHTWPDRRHVSVNMSRSDACTVSRTSVVVGDARCEMTYVPYIDGWPGPATTRAIVRSHTRHAQVA